MKEESSIKKYVLVMAVISIMALALRLIAGWQMYKHVPAVQHPGAETDMFTYIQYAKQFAAGTYSNHGGAYYYQPFYCAVFLRFLFTVFGSDPLVIVIVQAFLGAVTVLLTGLIGARIGGKKAGIIAALILTVFRNHILYTPFALIAVLQTFLITLTVYLSFLAFDRRQWYYWVFVGLTMSCSILSRGNLILLVPFVLFFIWRVHRPGAKKVLVPMATFLIAVYLPQMPFSIKNYQVTGRWTGPSIAGDVVLGIGNNPDAPPGTEGLPLTHYISYDEFDVYHHWSKDPASLKNNIQGWIKGNPGTWLELKLRTALLYLSNYESYNNITLYKCAREVPWLNSYVLLDFWIVVIPFIVLFIRMLITRNFKNRKLVFSVSVISLYSLSIILFYVLSRYKLPIVPMLAACAGMEYVRWLQILKSKKNKRKILLALSFIFSMYAVLKGFDIYRFNLESKIHSSIYPNGRLVDTPENMYIKDSGPVLWGNWQLYELQGSSYLEKDFFTEQEVNSSGLLRIYCGAASPSVLNIKVQHAGRLYSHTKNYERPDGGWIEIDLDKIVSQDHKVKFKIEVLAANTAGVFYTDLRNYGRSSLNGQALEGEWIIQLKIKK